MRAVINHYYHAPKIQQAAPRKLGAASSKDVRMKITSLVVLAMLTAIPAQTEAAPPENITRQIQYMVDHFDAGRVWRTVDPESGQRIAITVVDPLTADCRRLRIESAGQARCWKACQTVKQGDNR